MKAYHFCEEISISYESGLNGPDDNAHKLFKKLMLRYFKVFSINY